MNWYYVEQGKQAGPVDEAQFAQLRAGGKIREETLVWREGMANWQPCRDVQPGILPPPPVPDPPIITTSAAPPMAPHEALCVECGKGFAKEEMIHYGDKWVCAACKPVFMQKVAEGVTHLATVQGMITETELMARDYDVDIGGAISKGWDTFKANAGVMIGGAVLVWVASMACNIFNLIPIPFIGIIISLLLTPPLRAGLWLLYVRTVRGGSSDMNDVFRGFGSRYWQTVLAALIPMLLVIGIMFIYGLFFALLIPGFVPPRNSGMPHSPTLPPSALVPLGIVFVIVMLGYLFIATCWLFTMPLVIDKGLRFWPALELSRRMVMKHWWGTFALLIVVGLLFMAGAMACLVGLLLTGPLAFAALSAHYDKVFGDLAPQGSPLR